MSNTVTIQLPIDVINIIDTITKAGYEAFAVGGCIRDRLLNKEPEDYDITTSATPDEVKALFRRTVDTGIEHGTVTVMIGDTGYEVTTYRIDGKYEDSRHPKDVTFTKTLREDLLRRDFTINAMAYNDTVGLVDPFDGCVDLDKKIIRCVGNPRERLKEDALRIMRAVRFSAQLGYKIEEETFKAMKELSPNLANISEERIQVELVKLVISNHPEKLVTAYECGLTAVFMPEFDAIMNCSQNHPHHCYSVGMHTIKCMETVRADKYLRLAMLFHDIGKPLTKSVDEEGIEHFHGHPAESKRLCKDILKRLKFDNHTIDIVSKLVGYHDYPVTLTHKGIRKALNEMGEDIFPLVMEIKKADILSQSTYKREEKLKKLSDIDILYKEVLESNCCVSLKNLSVNGKDLIGLGYPSTPVLGQELGKLLDRVIEEPTLNSKDILLELAREDLRNA